MNPGVLTSGHSPPALNARLLGSPRPVGVPLGLRWTPAAIPGLALWLDAIDAGSIVHSSGQVSQWTDRSGFSRHATQTVANNRPTLFTSSADSQTTTPAQINGKQALFFDGVNDSLTLASSAIRNIAGFTLLCVVQFDTVGNGFTFNQNTVLFHGGPNNRQQLQLTAADTNAGVWNVNYRRVGTDGFAGFSSTVARAQSGVPYLVRVDHSYLDRSGSVAVNGATVASGFIAANTAGNSADESLTASLGVGGASRLFGRIGEVLMYSRLLGASDSESVVRYLAGRWGITLA